MGSDRHVVVGVLGELELWLGGRPQPVGHARRRSVLAVLAVEANRVVPVDSLIDHVWGERPPGTARSVLRVYLTHLRRVLAPTGITITRKGSGYTLAVEADVVDLHRFHRLLDLSRAAHEPRQALSLVEAALALWRGEPLAELDTPWAQAVRERSRRERAEAEADRIDWALACGRHRQLLPELSTRAEAEPLDERVAGQLVLALYRADRQADALAHYQHTRQRLVEELGADPGRALQELHQRVLAADPTLTQTEPAITGTTAGSPVVPRQLPAPPRWFTGRADHLAALDAALEDRGAMVISAIGGAGGIGKTWLALTWAHRHLDRFPDGQLFVDLRGFSPDSAPTDPAVAVRGFLDALGVLPDRIPTDLEARAALYRSLVAGRRMLVVLDNAATAEQVVPLLPGGTTCTVLVTSRHRLDALTARHGGRPLPLGVLTGAESRALLIAALGADRVAGDEPAAAELIALCGGFPLALGLIAARAQPDLPLAEAVTELRESGLDALDSDDPAASLPAVLSWSLRHLTDQQRTVFALLGVTPGPDIGLPAATSLTGLPERETRAVLRALTDASLLDHNSGGRHAMHDLVRAYATTTAHDLPGAVRQAALERVVDFYLHTAHAANHLLDPHSPPFRLDPPAPGVRGQSLPDLPTALAWLDTHHPHLLAAQRAAATHHLHQSVFRLARSMATFHWRRGHRHDDLIAWQAALDAAGHLPDPTARTLCHRRLGRANVELGRHEQAIDHLHQALALAEQHHDATQQALTHNVLARAWERWGDDSRALVHAHHALDLIRALDRPVWEADALNAVGWYAARLGEFDTARDHCRAALTLHRRHRNPDGEAGTLDSLGFIDHRTGRHDEAISHYQQALTLYRTLGNTTETADTLDRLGHPLAALGRHDQTRAVWREALELYREQGRTTDAERVRRQLDDLHDTPTAVPASSS
ncbi:AfsR/SARP family transcriptional regulator [Saccharothrix syringae]|uniref:Tetratricopeptide repeat protein n=1 Tax=Saccharothrix syringae TaxID=103733 RepID=A0A5Q0H2A7_SACSY|nr:BTAD domain-containing putative transcriptional regulator [Saccharothrix syringae]QFZ19960.1 tetratricopeptide repeat protein [Saccharothrix syringae]